MDANRAYRVLLVEDHDPDLVQLIFRRSRNTVAQAVDFVPAGTLASARAALAADHFDLILLDMQMPDGTGLSLAREIGDNTGSPRPVIIAVTASALPSERDSILAHGCDDFISKPYHPHDFIDLVVAHLTARSTARQALEAGNPDG